MPAPVRQTQASGRNMTQAAQNATREPTMEEILASIRRIIEDGNPPSGKDSGDMDSDNGDVEEILDFQREFGEDAIAESLQHAGAMNALGQKIGAKNAAPVIEAAFHREETLVDVKPDVWTEPLETEVKSAFIAPEQRELEQVEEETMAAVEHIELHQDEVILPEVVAETPFERHLRPILSDMAGRQVTAAFSDLTSAIEKERQQSLAEIAEDMIRPMLQEWLDNNLPTMVERLVREEIERVSRGGRR